MIEWLSGLPELSFEIPELNVLLAAVIAFLLLSLVARWLTRLLARLARSFEFLRELITQVASPVHLLLPLFGLQTVWSNAPDEVLFISQIRHINTLLIIAAFTWFGMRVVIAVQQVILAHHPVNVVDNLTARRVHTQTKVLVQTLSFFVLLFGAAAMLMTFPAARQFGTSLLASAGVAGLAVGFAAKPVLGNLIAGLQIALTQPIRLDDVVIVENEWGRVEEITGTYVVVRIWDERRLIVPLQWFIENPFQNWTRQTSALIGSVFFWVDYAIEIEPLRNELDQILKEVPHLWDGRVKVLQVTDNNEKAMQLRILASSNDSSLSWDLRCYIREKIISYIACNYPQSLPLLRASLEEEAHTAQAPQVPTEPERQPPV